MAAADGAGLHNGADMVGIEAGVSFIQAE